MNSLPSSKHPQPGTKIDAVLDPVIPELNELVAKTPGTLSLAQGMVNWSPPVAVKLAMNNALLNQESSLNRYGPVRGDPALLELITQKLMIHNGLDLAESMVMVTAGSNMAFHAIAQVLCDPGDEVILPLPYYFNHFMAIQLAGGVPLPVNAGLIPNPELIEAAITKRTRAIVTISPNNPSGIVFPQTLLAAINGICAQHGLLHISDEAYEDFVFGDVPHWSPGSLPGAGNHTVSLYSFSKAYGMAGWRLGYMSAPIGWSKALAKVQDTVLICPPRFCQQAAIAALADGSDWMRQNLSQFMSRYQFLLNRFAASNDRPWRFLHQPNGAFYCLLEVDCGCNGDTLMRQLVRDYRVATIGGCSFGFKNESSVLRISVGMLEGAELIEAFDRLEAGLLKAVQNGVRTT